MGETVGLAHRRDRLPAPALEIFRATGHRYREASVHNKLADALIATGDRHAARAHHAEALAIATQTGDLDEQIRARKGLLAVTTPS